MSIWNRFGLSISLSKSAPKRRPRHLFTSNLASECLEHRFLLNSDPVSSDIGASSDHLAVMALVPVADATHIAVDAGGRWSNASTWAGGQAPDDNARVHVPAGSTVIYDVFSDVDIATIRIDGTFQFDSSTNTRLVVDTLVGMMGSEIHVGTHDSPIAGDVTAELLISTDGEIDRAWDPTGISRGLISMGRVEMFG